MNANYTETKEALLQAALSHVAFDGWTDATFQAAVRDADVPPAVARAVCPRGAVDLALAYHAAGDQAMIARLQAEDLSAKRATLSGVYSATVLYWLGDDSTDHQATWAFLDRRIDNVMQIEKLKSQVRENPVLSRLMAGPNKLMEAIKRPSDTGGFPGRWSKPRN